MYNASTTSTTDQPREDPRIVQLRDNILANKLKWAFKIYYSSIKTCVSIMCKKVNWKMGPTNWYFWKILSLIYSYGTGPSSFWSMAYFLKKRTKTRIFMWIKNNFITINRIFLGTIRHWGSEKVLSRIKFG